MSVSMKDRKAVIYGEVERLRALLDKRDAEIALLRETVQRRDAEIAELRAKSEERKAKSEEQPAAEDREVTLSKIEIGKRLAILMKRSVRNGPNNTFESYVDGEWVTVPQRVVRFATGG